MTSPSAPIDADLSPFSNDVYYVLEESGIWKTTNLTAAGASTWEQVWSSGDFEGSEFGALLRIRCAYRENLVYVLGWGYDDASVSKAFVLKSQNAGGSWVQNWVAEIDDPEDGSIEYVGIGGTIDTGGETVGRVVGGTIFIDVKVPCRYDSDPNHCNGSPETQQYVNVRFHPPAPDPNGGYPSIEWDIGGICPSQGYDDDGDAYPWVTNNRENLYSSVYGDPLTTHADTTLDTRYENEVFGFGSMYGYPGRWSACPNPCEGVEKTASYTITNIEINGTVYDSDYASKGFDCARSNPDWVYVGLTDKVMKSEDGSETWEELITDHGAYDICVDPQAAGAIYYWDTEGELRLNSGGADQGSLLSDSTYNQHGRLARDINSGRLWAIDVSGNVRVRNLGSWTTQYEGSQPMGIKSYIDGNLIFLDSDSIQLSSDYGETWSDKTGDWTEYGSPKAANLMDDNL